MLKLGFGKPKVKLQDLVIFTRQLSTMISAGVPLTRSLATLGSDSEISGTQTSHLAITKDVESGLPLGEAFGKYPNISSPMSTSIW